MQIFRFAAETASGQTATTQVSSTVQLEIPLEVLCRLLQSHSLRACEFRTLDEASHRAGCWAVKSSCKFCSTLPGPTA
ncbi:MAG: hypothetical protein ACK5ME_03570 [Parahaliea sp.]